MCVKPVSSIGFKAGKIELNKLHKKDLSNYDSIKLLARQHYCDFLIEKKENPRLSKECVVYNVLARRKWIMPDYIFVNEMTTVHKNAPLEEVACKIFEATTRAALAAKEQTLKLAKAFIR